MSEEDNSSTSKKPVAEHFNLTGHSLEDGIFIKNRASHATWRVLSGAEGILLHKENQFNTGWSLQRVLKTFANCIFLKKSITI